MLELVEKSILNLRSKVLYKAADGPHGTLNRSMSVSDPLAHFLFPSTKAIKKVD
ncbi:MAG: hypothetical protein ABI597_13420 [Gammaproteobacteria bacterium]